VTPLTLQLEIRTVMSEVDDSELTDDDREFLKEWANTQTNPCLIITTLPVQLLPNASE